MKFVGLILKSARRSKRRTALTMISVALAVFLFSALRAVLDGFDVPMALVHVFDRPRESLRSIELFTDGYFKPATTPDVAAWEASFAEVERIDPEKIDAYPSVKGTAGRIRTDDRTVVIIHL